MKDSTRAPSFCETFYNGYNANIIFVKEEETTMKIKERITKVKEWAKDHVIEIGMCAIAGLSAGVFYNLGYGFGNHTGYLQGCSDTIEHYISDLASDTDENGWVHIDMNPLLDKIKEEAVK